MHGIVGEEHAARGSHHKKLPSNFLTYSKDWLWSYLAGYIDGDGTIHLNKKSGIQYVDVCTTSFAMAQQLQLIATKLGIYSRLCQATLRTENIKIKGKSCKANAQPFNVVFHITKDHVNSLKESIKIVERLKSPAIGLKHVLLLGEQKVSTKNPSFYPFDFVYDVTTESGLVVVSGLLVSNSGGVAQSRGGGSTSRLERLGQLLNLPKTLPYSATLSKIDGKVHSISKTSTGGHEILIGREKDVHKHYVPSSLDLKVEVGQEIERGDPISSGPINPHQLLQLKDMGAVRKYLTTEMGDMYKDVGGVRRRNVEVVVRNLTNLTEVVDSGKSDHLAGDILPTSIVEAHNRMAKEKDDKILHRPILRGIKESALLKSEDYLSRMNFQRIQNTLIEGAGKAWKTTPRSYDPLSSWSNSSIDIQKDKNDAKY